MKLETQTVTDNLIAMAPRSGVFMMSEEAGAPIGDVTGFVVRLLKAGGGWLEPNEARLSYFLTRGRRDTRELGIEIDAAYGLDGMATIHGIVDELLPEGAAAELAAAWNGIGEWEA